MADVGIRLATPEDADALVEIHRRARDTYYRGVVTDEELDDPAEYAKMREAYRGSILKPGRTALCAERDGEVVGFAALGPPFEPVVDADPSTVAQLFGLYVLPGAWGLGIGSGLHDESLQVWRAEGITIGRLEVWGGNERARAFYARRGWRPDGHERPGPADVTFLRLCLAVDGATGFDG